MKKKNLQELELQQKQKFMNDMFQYYCMPEKTAEQKYNEFKKFKMKMKIKKDENFSFLTDIFNFKNISANEFLKYCNDVDHLCFDIDWELIKKAKEAYLKNIAYLSNFDNDVFNFVNTEQMKSDKSKKCLEALKINRDTFKEILIDDPTTNIYDNFRLFVELCWDNVKIDVTKQGANFQLIWKQFHDAKNMPGQLTSLPNSGSSSLVLSENGFIEYKGKGRKKKNTESIDLKYFHNNNVYYISHKYNNNTGGGQSQIKNHAFDHLQKFKGNDNEYLVCILEGYYDESFDEYSSKLNKNTLFFNKISDFYKRVL